MEPIRLILVRHGNTFEEGAPVTWVGSATDMLLTHKGREQAIALGQMFARQKIAPARIVYGPLQRQKETAEIIAQHLQNAAPLEETPFLAEIDYGTWEGRTNEEIEAQWPGSQEQWQKHLAWQDSFGGSKEDMAARLIAFITSIREQCAAGQTIIAVTSNGIMRLLTTLVDGVTSATDFSTYKVKTGNYSIIAVYPDRLAIESWNQSPTNA